MFTHNFAKPLFFLLLILTVSLPPLHSQDYSISEAGNEAVRSLTSVAEMLIAESFTPMSGYGKGDVWMIGSPAIFQVLQLHEEPLVEGKDMTGLSLGLGGGYALTDRLMVYLIGAGMKMQGKLSFAPYESTVLSIIKDRVVESDTDYTLLSVNAGVGFEVIDRDWISVPLFFGPHLQYFATEIRPAELEPLSGTTITSAITGSGLLSGVSGGLAAYMKFFGRFAITPYLIGMGSFNRPGFDGEGTVTSPSPPSTTFKESYTTDPVWGLMFGLDVGFHGKSGWSLSLALGDLLGMLIGTGSTMANEGVVIRPAVLVATFRI